MRTRTALFFVVSLMLPFLAQGVIIDKILAIVNDSVITQSELYAIDKLDLNLSGLPERDSLLQRRIDYHLVLQQLYRQPPVTVSDDEVADAWESLELRFGGAEGLDQFISDIGMNSIELIQEIRNQISIHKFVTDRFRPFVNITIEDAEEYYRRVYKPAGEILGKEVPPFEESFSEVQRLLVESRLKDKIKEWLDEIRRDATVHVKQ